MLREIFQSIVGTTDSQPRTTEQWKDHLLAQAVTQRERDDVIAMFDRAQEEETNRAA